jgi:hypothetical protein
MGLISYYFKKKARERELAAPRRSSRIADASRKEEGSRFGYRRFDNFVVSGTLIADGAAQRGGKQASKTLRGTGMQHLLLLYDVKSRNLFSNELSKQSKKIK